MKRTVAVVAAVGALAAAGLAAPPLVAQARTRQAIAGLPDQGDPTVRAEQTRIARLVEKDFWASGPKECAARLLRTEGEHSWALVSCTGWFAGEPATPGNQTALFDNPVHVVGDTVRWMQDGAGYGESIDREFPADLAPLAKDSQLGIGPVVPTPPHP